MANGSGKTREEFRQNSEILLTGAIYRVGGLEIDPARGVVRRGGEEIPVRLKTLQFLVFLLERPDRVVTKDELLAGVWADTNVTEDVLVRSVGELRKALEDDPRNPRIFKTYPKRGYGIDLPVEKAMRPEVAVPVVMAPAPPRGKSYGWIWIVSAAALVLAAGGWLVSVALNRKAAAVGIDDLAEVGWWRLDEGKGLTAQDTSGKRQAGTLRGATHWVSGTANGGLMFDGSEARVDGRDRGALPWGAQARTISAWIQTTTAPLEENAIFEYGQREPSALARRFSLGLDSSGRAVVWGASDRGPVVGKTLVSDSVWHLLAASFEAGKNNRVRLYVDGRPDQAQELPTGPETLERGWWSIGHFLYAGSSFRGAIRDVRVFNQVVSDARMSALYRCSAGLKDLGDYYYFPVFSDHVTIGERGPQDESAPIAHEEKEYGGVQLARSDGVCSVDSQRGADVGQDLRMSVDLLAPSNAEGKATQAGPYLRSRPAAPGDGVIGGTSAGYWVQLWSNGEVRVRRLNPTAVVAFAAIAGFDSRIYHHLELEARGDRMKVSVDGKAVVFRQDGNQVEAVAIPSAWEGIGYNRGTAGVLFSALDARGQAGGQRARNFRVVRLGAAQ